MNSEEYNIWAILVATVVSIVIGIIWYAPPIFGRPWQRYVGIDKPGAQAVAIWALCYLVLSFTMAYLLKNLGAVGVEAGFRWGSTVGLAVAAMGMAPNYAFARKPLGLYLIEGTYVVVSITVMGVIIGAWR